jgi:dTMP kinase|tara:strand:+ start:1445 stop:2071 length:627 start_codon:yes stop_codon:yes gene_type:complete
MTERGKFIVFEGGEGSGKSTQARLLQGYFKESGISSTQIREPGGSPTAEKIREIIINPEIERLPETEFLLFSAARVELFKRVVIPNLELGIHVLSDRNYLSSIVYQGYVKGVPLELIDYINRVLTEGNKPDLTFIFDVPVEEGLASKVGAERNRFEDEGPEFHERVRRGYLEMVGKTENCVLIERGNRNAEEIYEEVKGHVRERLSIG